MAVSRNAPCPCGSGKKYKSCCMRQDQLKESRDLSVSDTEGYLFNALYSYAQTDRFRFEAGEAFALYWGGRYALAHLHNLDPEDMRRTMEWFVHDYPTRADGRYVIDLFVAEQATPYPQALKDLLAAWSRSITGMFRVVSLSADGRLELFDCLRGAEVCVHNALLARRARKGDVLVGRLFELAGVVQLSHNTAILPAAYEPGLLEYVTNAHRLYCDTHPGAGWDQFLRENGHIFQAYLLSPKAEALRSLIGPGTAYHDPAVLRDRLREHTAQMLREEQQKKLEAERQQAALHRTSTGIIVPGKVDKDAEAKPEAPKPKILLPGRDE